MSSYWAGYSGTGLVLKEDEFEKFLEKYKEKNPSMAESLEEAREDIPLEEYRFLKSAYAGEVIEDLQDTDDAETIRKTTEFCELTDDCIDGLAFWPFFRPDGRMNIMEQKPDGEWEDDEMHHPMWEAGECSCYVIWSERSFTSPKVFIRPAYNSYEDFVQEFKDAVGAYLPDDFDWNAHLGYMSYACYA